MYSVKCINKKVFQKKVGMKKYLKQEMGIMQKMNHKNVIELRNCFEGKIRIYHRQWMGFHHNGILQYGKFSNGSDSQRNEDIFV